MRLSSDGVNYIYTYVSLFVVVLFQKVTTGNILIGYKGNSMEEGYGIAIVINNDERSIDLPLLRGGMWCSLIGSEDCTG